MVGWLIGMSILLLFVFILWLPDCENTRYETLYSPNRAHKAILYARDCGATTGYATNISLAKADEDIDTGFRIFTADYDNGKANLHPVHPELIDINVRWINDRLLELSYMKRMRGYLRKSIW